MNRYIKTICLLLCGLIVLQAGMVAVNAKANLTLLQKQTLVSDNGGVATETAEWDAVTETAEETEEAPVEETEEVPAAEETEADLDEEEAASEPAAEETEAATESVTEPERAEPTIYDEVPLYFQTDYPDTLYGNGTIKSSGCSITSLAMVASYMTGHTYLPDELAGWFGGYIGNNLQRLEYASDQLQLPWSRAENCHDALRALKEGKIVIALMNGNSIFTDSQHYIVWAGVTVDGKVIVNDPYEPNYSGWRLKNGFENGFEEDEVCWGFAGGWVYDVSAMPSDPFIYEEAEYDGECRYPDMELSQEDMNLLARLLWLEARGESQEGQQAVAEVILNRLADEDFPDTMRGIIYAEGQFPNTNKLGEATPTQTQYDAIDRALNGPYILPMDVVFYATFKTNKNVWGKIGAHYFCYRWDWTGEE